MRLLLVSPLPPPVGGIATWTQSVINYFKDSSEINITHIDSAVRWRRVQSNSIAMRLIGGSIQAIREYFKVKKILTKQKIDVLHLCTSGSFSFYKDYLILKKCKELSIPTALHIHMGRIEEICNKKNWEFKILQKCISTTDAVIVLDEKSLEAIVNKIGHKNINKVPNLLDDLIFNPVSQQSEELIENNLVRLVFVGHITKKKGISDLVQACSMLSECEFELILIGPCDVSYRKELEEIAKKKNMGAWLKFSGTKDKQFVCQELMKSDIFLLPSYSEGFPLSLMEAMALRRAIIASNVGAIPEMLSIGSDEPCGICIESGNVQQLRIALLDLIGNPEKRNLLGKRAQNKVNEDYSTEAVINKLTTIWNSKWSQNES